MKDSVSEKKSFDFLELFNFKVPYARKQQTTFHLKVEKLLAILAVFYLVSRNNLNIVMP